MRNYIYNKVTAESKAIAFTIHLLLFTLITSCSQEAVIAPQDTPDALAMMDPDTPVGISAQLQAQGGTWSESRANQPDATETNWYADGEIYSTEQKLNFVLDFPTRKRLTTKTKTSFNELSKTEPFSALALKDFNLTEGNGRSVSRWTILKAYTDEKLPDGFESPVGYETLVGFARLQADSDAKPVLNYGEMKRASVKVTIVLKDENGACIPVNEAKVSTLMFLRGCNHTPIYIPENQTKGVNFYTYVGGITTLRDDEAIKLSNLGWALYAPGNIKKYELGPMLNADGNESYYGENNNILTAIVTPSPTHILEEDQTYTPIEQKFTDDEILTITVNKDPDGNGPQTTGTYKLKLSDVKLSETENLTALKSGEHYILTVTLKHNTLVSATATVAGWNEASADVTLLGNDPSFIAPYEYDANTNTYTIHLDNGIEACLADRAKNHPDAAVESGIPTLAVVSGTETDEEAIYNAIDAGKTTFIVVGELTDNLCTYIKNSKAAPGTINLILADATSIGDRAFYACTALTNVNLPKATSIEEYAFYYCQKLTSVNFPKVTSIGAYAFALCSALTSVNFPEVTSIGENAFMDCTALTNVNLPKATTIGKHSFWTCNTLTSLTFGSVIRVVGENSFLSVGTEAGGCALTLVSGQEHFHAGTPNGTPVVAAAEDADKAARTWAGNTWKSITIK